MIDADYPVYVDMVTQVTYELPQLDIFLVRLRIHKGDRFA